jgi:hypothetical protein
MVTGADAAGWYPPRTTAEVRPGESLTSRPKKTVCETEENLPPWCYAGQSPQAEAIKGGGTYDAAKHLNRDLTHTPAPLSRQR